MSPCRWPENHPSGDLKIRRKCYNGLTNRHSTVNAMMITKRRKIKINDEKLRSLESRN